MKGMRVLLLQEDLLIRIGAIQKMAGRTSSGECLCFVSINIGSEIFEHEYEYNMTLEQLYSMTFDFAIEDSPSAF